MMKRISTLLLALVLLCMPALAGAETIDLSPIGITLEVPDSWYCGTVWQGTDSELAKTFNFDEATLASVMNDQTMCSMVAIPDHNTQGQLQVVTSAGSDLIDMRNISDEMWKIFYEGFMGSYTLNVFESGRFDGKNTTFVRVGFESQGVYGMQYTTLVNGTIYIVQYASYNGEINDSTKAELDAIASSMKFLN